MKTPLYHAHTELGAKIVEFASWEMPLFYTSAIQEHLFVRQAAGLFDISHMGRIRISGKEAAVFLDYLSTNKITTRDLAATYTVWCNPAGYCIDDLIVYRQTQEEFFVVVNAVNRHRDLDHLKKYGEEFDVQIVPCFESEGILALQGPKAEELMAQFFPAAAALKPMHFLCLREGKEELIFAATGYTGERGFEICASSQRIVALWEKILQFGPGIVAPIGLAARDSLRLEMGYALYGHEISQTIAPIESVSAWTVKWDKPHFLGKEALEKLNSFPSHKRSSYGIVMKGKEIAREGCPILHRGKKIGVVTSGGYSPCLKRAIALVLVEETLEKGSLVDVQVRMQQAHAEVVDLPFNKN